MREQVPFWIYRIAVQVKALRCYNSRKLSLARFAFPNNCPLLFPSSFSAFFFREKPGNRLISHAFYVGKRAALRSKNNLQPLIFSSPPQNDGSKKTFFIDCLLDPFCSRKLLCSPHLKNERVFLLPGDPSACLFYGKKSSSHLGNCIILHYSNNLFFVPRVH